MTTNTITSHDVDGRLYRTTPVLSMPYASDRFVTPATYRWWVASALLPVIEAHTQVFATMSSAPVMSLLIDPFDAIGAELWRHFDHVGDPLPPRTDEIGPVVIVPVVEFHARRVLHACDLVVERHLIPVAPRARSWLVVAAAGGISVFDAPISTAPGELDDTNQPLVTMFELQR